VSFGEPSNYQVHYFLGSHFSIPTHGLVLDIVELQALCLYGGVPVLRETLIVGIDRAINIFGVSFSQAYEQSGLTLKPNLFLQLIWPVPIGRERR
jgi:hypothetical protein